jgi:hypothetical protein
MDNLPKSGFQALTAPAQVAEAFATLAKLGRLRVVTTAGEATIYFSEREAVIDLRLIIPSGASGGAGVPAPTADGQVLLSDGDSFAWYP